MILVLVSFLAGLLTVLAPCVLPVLPIIIGGSAQGSRRRNPYVITAALASAIVLFTLLLKFSTALITIPQQVWSTISGAIIILFGLISLFPTAWDKVSIKFGLGSRSDQLLSESAQKKSIWGDVLIGLSLGPVFSSCSPTYFLILATVLPRNFAAGLVYLMAYAAGLALVLLLISLLGQKFILRARWAADPRGWFKRGLGILFILVGIFILTGYDKRVQSYLVEKSYFNIANVETAILQKVATPSNSLGVPASSPALTSPTSSVPLTSSATTLSTPTVDKSRFPRYREITDPGGYVNSSPITIGQLIGKKVILVDFMTYSCINCIRTFPYLKAWYEKYKDQGFEIIGIHTPEFAFEHNIDNVRAAMKQYGLIFPVVLDNNYGTWNAYGNNVWPRKYLIDIDGYVVYDHSGEGHYDEAEKKIQELLAEKSARDNRPVTKQTSLVKPANVETAEALSPETYFGADRNELFANGQRGKTGEQQLVAPGSFKLNQLYLEGTWNFDKEYARAISATSRIIYRYAARRIYLVGSARSNSSPTPSTAFPATAAAPVRVRVLRDGQPLTAALAGADITLENGQSYLIVKDERLYSLVKDKDAFNEHTLELIIEAPGLQAYTFTFG